MRELKADTRSSIKVWVNDNCVEVDIHFRISVKFDGGDIYFFHFIF